MSFKHVVLLALVTKKMSSTNVLAVKILYTTRLTPYPTLMKHVCCITFIKFLFWIIIIRSYIILLIYWITWDICIPYIMIYSARKRENDGTVRYSTTVQYSREHTIYCCLLSAVATVLLTLKLHFLPFDDSSILQLAPP